jgi:hypothetical protein
MVTGLSAVLMAVYLIWVAGRAHRFGLLRVPRWVPAFTAEVHPFIPVAIVAFYVLQTWGAPTPATGVLVCITAVQLVGWLLLSDDDDDRWKRRRRRLADRFRRRSLAGET